MRRISVNESLLLPIVVAFCMWPHGSSATSCRPLSYPEWARIDVVSSEWDEHHESLQKYQISLPAELLGESLRVVNVWMSTDETGADVDLIAPISFDVGNGNATATFGARSDWPHLSVTAAYGNDVRCGPRLSVEIATNE